VTVPDELVPPLAVLPVPVPAVAGADDELGELLHAEAATAVAASSTPTA
jgi:hypothetical protein